MTAPNVTMGGQVMCSFGVAPCAMIVPPTPKVLVESKPAATIANSEPANIPTFGMCTTLSNPQVAAATAAALGVLTPMPCEPVLTPWIPMSPTVLIGGQPVLVAGSTCICAYGGVVNILDPGATKTLS